MQFEKIIVLDDEKIIRKSIQDYLRKRRYSVAVAEGVKEAETLLQKDNFDLIFVDINLPDGSGTDLLDTIAMSPNPPVVVIMTGDASINSAVDCIKKGAFDYIVKPFDLEQLEIVIKKAELFDHLKHVNQFFTQELTESALLVGKSEPMQHLRGMIRKVAATEATVLISGENGTGKELIAHELYKASSRSDKPFIKVNCAAISETLMESELFGHEKGAFTGAIQRRLGRFELAHTGTILLDEISEISPRLQAKLLRVLQEKEFERVGGGATIKVDARVIATTNRNLFKEVEEGNFREDLYYRLNVFPLYVPALRDRGDDLMLLANEFLARFSQKHGKGKCEFSKEAANLIKSHPWPGNVRELQNTIERSVILTDNNGQVLPAALALNGYETVSAHSKDVQRPKKTGKKEVSQKNKNSKKSVAPLHDVEKEHILTALEKAEGKRKKAAEMLNISLNTLRNKLEEYEEEGTNVA